MSIKKYKPEQIVVVLRQIEVQIANGKTPPQACKGSRNSHPDLLSVAEGIVADLHSMGIISRIDRAILAAYCQEWATWIESVEKVRKLGTVTFVRQGKDGPGYYTHNPHLAIANRARRQMHSLLSEMGLSPTSRARLAVKPPAAPVIPGKDFSHYFQ